MAKSLNKLKNDLRRRWTEEKEFVNLWKFITKNVNKREQSFIKKNKKLLEDTEELFKEEESAIAISGKFRNYLDMSELIKDRAPTNREEESKKIYIDLRGIEVESDTCFRGVIFRGVDFSFSHSTGVGFSYQTNMYKCVFNHADFSNSLIGHYFKNCQFKKVNLREADTSYCIFENCIFEECKCGQISMPETYIKSCVFLNCDFRKMRMGCSTYVIDSVFKSCDFKFAAIQEFPVPDTDIRGATYRNTKFEDCGLTFLEDGFIPPGVV